MERPCMAQLSFVAFALLTLSITANAAERSSYPAKPMRVIVGFPPGGQSDIVARLLGQKFAEALETPIVIENIPGAAGSIAADRVAKATPDGYTLGLVAAPQVVINPSLYKLAYDPVKDFAPISQAVTAVTVLAVHNAVPAKNVSELITLAKNRPGELTFASSGSGTEGHLAGELLKYRARIDIKHIPYKGVPAAMPDLLGGRVTMTFSPSAAVLPLAREGKLRVLAVTSLKRDPSAPDSPTIAESGYPGFEVTGWSGLLAPSGTPTWIVHKLHLETVKALGFPDVRARLAGLGLQAVGNSPDEFAALIKAQIPKWAKLIREAGIKPE
jgi:tripartite-type tricarboxylate transporter receptor subunit TctC